MRLPNILKFKPSVNDATNSPYREPLIAKDTGWFAKSVDKDIDCPLVEYDLNGGFFALLGLHGMRLDGSVATTAQYGVVDFADTANAEANIVTADETGGSMVAADGSTAIVAIATSDLTGGESAGRVVAGVTAIDIDNTELVDTGFTIAASTTLTFTWDAAVQGKTVAIAFAIEGEAVADGVPVVGGLATTSMEAGATPDDIVITGAGTEVLLGVKVTILD